MSENTGKTGMGNLIDGGAPHPSLLAMIGPGAAARAGAAAMQPGRPDAGGAAQILDGGSPGNALAAAVRAAAV